MARWNRHRRGLGLGGRGPQLHGHRRTEQGIVRQADDATARRRAQQDADLAASEDALRQARKEWEDALAAAAGKHQAQGEEPAPSGPGEFTIPTTDELLARFEGLDTAVAGAEKRTVGVQGTFNAAAAQGLASGGPADRIAQATEETARGVNRLVREAAHGGLVFE